MKLIEKLSYNSANYLTKKLGLSHERRAINYFGFQAIYGDIFKVVIMAAISLCLDSFIPTMLIAFSFAFLRKNAGGFHMKSEGGCIIFTTCICVIPGTIIRYISLNSTSLIFLIVTFIFGCICLYRFAPRGTKNNQIEDKLEILKFKRKSFISFFVIYLLVIIFFFSFKQYQYSIALSIGCLLEVITITPVFDSKKIKKTIQ